MLNQLIVRSTLVLAVTFSLEASFTAAPWQIEGIAQNAASHGPAQLSEIGIDRSGLSMQDEAMRQKTLENIHALHATWFRDGPSSGSVQGVANFVDEVRLAKQQSLKVLVNIAQMDEDYDGPLPTHATILRQRSSPSALRMAVTNAAVRRNIFRIQHKLSQC